MTRDDPSEAPPWIPLPRHPGSDLVALGGALDPARVLAAYREGIFPWFDTGQVPMWWSPDPRAVLPLDAGFHVPRRLARRLRQGGYRITCDEAFEDVMRASADRPGAGTWIHADMRRCYLALHRQGHAHSLEVWQDDALVGGIYGVAFGAGFAAESMFHRVRDMSKVALVELVGHLRARGFTLLDVQFRTAHLTQFGCVEIPRAAYLARVAAVRDDPRAF